VGEIKRVYVRPEGRGQGIGRRLTRAALDEAKRLGYHRVVLDTLPSMGSAVALYRKMGFRPIPAYWKHPVPGALFFEYALE
jgi:ribosomal protein S18 acetylase RimI-like enzyme